MRLTVEERRARLAADCLAEAWSQAWAATWTRRAEALDAARPRPGDYSGQATPADLSAAYDRLTEAAKACRARATGADGLVQTQLVDTATDVAGGAG